jgi:hypothetical protein
MQALLDGVKRKVVLPPGGDLDLTLLGVKDEASSPAGKNSQPNPSQVHDREANR